jgi:hypothetical protein
VSGLPGLAAARVAFLRRIKAELLFEKELQPRVLATLRGKGLPNNITHTINVADIASASSCRIALEWGNRLPGTYGNYVTGQGSGSDFATITQDFLKQGFDLLGSLRSGEYHWRREHSVTHFDQYQHLAIVSEALNSQPQLKAVFGEEYLIKPDITVGRMPVDPDSIGGRPSEPVARYASLLSDASLGSGKQIMLASVSCKLTIRSDRAQNTRTEALNLIRNRKGRTPAIVSVTAEPLPGRIASIAYGTGDIDCVYHAALYELQQAVAAAMNDDQAEILETMVSGRRLRDLSDLVLDLMV